MFQKSKKIILSNQASISTPILILQLLILIIAVSISIFNTEVRSIMLLLPTQIIKYLLFNIVLFFAARQDLKQHKVDNKYSLAILAIGLIGPTFDSVIGAIMCYLMFFFVCYVSNLGMGGGDAKIVGACGFVLGTIPNLFALLIGLSVSLITEATISIFKKQGLKRGFPLIPYIAAGCSAITIILILKGFNLL